MRFLLRLLILCYQWTLSPLIGGHCRFAPSCSHYALEAINTHGPWLGLKLLFHRLGRCHPWQAGGNDPVPEALPRIAGGRNAGTSAAIKTLL